MNVSKPLFTLVAILSATEVACAVTALIPVDTSWRAIGPVGDLTGQPISSVGLTWEAANAGWNSSTSYNDSTAAGWKNAIENNHFPNPPYLRYWVDGDAHAGSSPAYFRKEFIIPGIPTGGSLNFGVDDDAQVYLNGILVFNDGNRLATEVTGLDLTAFLHGGTNLLAVKAHDNEGDQSAWGLLTVDYQVPEARSITLALFGFALAARTGIRQSRLRYNSRCLV